MARVKEDISIHWRIKEAEPGKVSALTKVLGISKSIVNLLVLRGVNTYDEAKSFFRPSQEHFNDSFLMKDMSKSVDRIVKAIKNKEKILVYGDYDVDGTTAVSLMYSYLSLLTDRADYYIPDRYKEGYGLSKEGVDFAIQNDFTLVITLDCGIKAVEMINYGYQNNIDFIVCDHHLPGDVLPPAYGILDPKQHDCPYPYKELSGCGIGFKVIQALNLRFADKNIDLLPFTDLVAISTAADIVPITGENRALSFIGLKQINQKPRKGVAALLNIAEMDREVKVSDLVFVLAPRINAAGRIHHAKMAVELMISKVNESALANGLEINQANTDRKEIDKDITQQAIEYIEDNEDLWHSKTTVLYDPTWHKGVIGIVASRLIETYYRPTILLTESNGKATGSARSVKGYDVYEAISACSDLLLQFGGHKYAAGLTMEIDKIPLFQKKFEKVVGQTIEDHMLVREIEIDGVLQLSEITPKFYRILKQFEPFGPGNMRPVFMSKKLKNAGGTRKVGKDLLHLKVHLIDREGIIVEGIAFNRGDALDFLENDACVDVVYTLDENIWNGNATIQLKVLDIKPSV